MADEEWVTDDELARMKLEDAVHGNETHEERTLRIFRENAAFAAQSIVALSRRSDSERVRLDASKYVVERVLGRIDDGGAVADPIEKLLNDIVKKS